MAAPPLRRVARDRLVLNQHPQRQERNQRTHMARKLRVGPPTNNGNDTSRTQQTTILNLGLENTLQKCVEPMAHGTPATKSTGCLICGMKCKKVDTEQSLARLWRKTKVSKGEKNDKTNTLCEEPAIMCPRHV